MSSAELLGDWEEPGVAQEVRFVRNRDENSRASDRCPSWLLMCQTICIYELVPKLSKRGLAWVSDSVMVIFPIGLLCLSNSHWRFDVRSVYSVNSACSSVQLDDSLGRAVIEMKNVSCLSDC